MKAKQQTKQKSTFPIVGIGASAGGLKAFTQLLEEIPDDIGMAFMLIQHLDPTKKSLLPETLARTTTLPLIEVTDGIKIKVNHIYVMPSDSFMTISDGILHLIKRKKRSDPHNPIDSFFESLAKNHDKDAIGIVLSGTGNDGTEGLQAIKKSGGRTFAQDNTAQFKAMPQSAIDSGSVDFTLPPDGIARTLIQISSNITGGLSKSKPEENPTIDAILAILHTKTGMDFRQYRVTTINRRIQRRMLLNHIETVKDYAEFLNNNPHEVEALHKDMLIHVTSFFREPEQFEALKKSVLPTLLNNQSSKKPINVWIAGCATGEEAYSFAIVLHELFGKKTHRIPIKILATDISKNSIEEASRGLYKEVSMQHVSSKHLRRFFTKVKDGYEVKKTIRAMCEFTVHDITQKPPRLNNDIVSCRNVLIYLEEALQQKALFMFSSALKPDGFLLLGKSEGLGASSKLFSPIDSKQRIYSKKAITSNLRKTINTQVGMSTTLLSSQKVTIPQPNESNHTARQQKISKLKEAVLLTQEYANEIINELDVINEELQSTNEELTSSNEELQTTNEELETTQEELQTANEEMTTMNEELLTRNEEVIRARDYADAIVRTVRHPLIILSQDLRIISANQSFYETFQVTLKETENRLIYDLGNKQWDIPKLRTLLEKIFPQNTTVEDFEIEHDFETIGQRTMLLTARTMLQGPEKNPLILLAIEDITERQELEKQKDLFIGIASHELKTPVTTMKGYAQMLEKRLSQNGDSKDTYFIQEINKQTDRLTTLINDLLNVSKIQAGKLVLEKRRFDLNALVTKTVVDFQYVTETHQIIKEGEIKERVYGDQSRIEQVLSNLITNAIKYSPHADEQSSSTNKVIVRVWTDKSNAIVSVQDFGFGITKKDQTKVFERFYRTGDKKEMNVAGFGLGLYIAAEIVKGHHGKIWVESTKGKGSTFYFTLPLKKEV